MLADAGKPARDGGARPHPPPGERKGGTGRKVILLIEDNEADRDIYGGLLWYNGFEVVHAADGAAGVAKAVELAPDAILLDMTLPGELSGLDVLDRLRAEAVEAPIMALTAQPEEELGQAVREKGAVGYLEKPITPFEVVRQILHLVGPTTGMRPG